MATNIVAESEMFFNSFEPKQSMRFIMYMDGVPSYIIKSSGRPQLEQPSKEIHHINLVRFVKGKSRWQPIAVTLYDPIVPSGAQAVMEWVRLAHESITGRDGYFDFYAKDLIFHGIGPTGDVVEEWILKGAWPTNINFGEQDWASDEPLVVQMQIQYNYAVLNF